jgi:N-6 DNA Methylase
MLSSGVAARVLRFPPFRHQTRYGHDVLAPDSPATAIPDPRPYERFLATVANASNETSIRESFVALAASAFSDSEFVRELTLGAEHSVSFRQSGLIRRGRVDSFIDNLLIEFKLDIRTQQGRWINQLRGYVAGAWTEDGGYGRSYLAVLTDGIRWLVHAATPADPAAPPDTDNIRLILVDQWAIPNNAAEAPLSLAQFLNRLFFRHTLLKPTALNFSRDFGLLSSAFISASARLRKAIQELGGEPQMKTHREAWAEDIRTSYGGGDTPAELFVRHTYLALLARLLVFAALERRPLNSADAEAVMDGNYFYGRRIGNLVEDDYFQWPLLASRSKLQETWAALVNQLNGYDLGTVNEDVLKPLYEQLVDPETRHDLGEYYTPDWLAEEVVCAAASPWISAGNRPRVLDPTCGSGSFLRAVLHFLRAATGAPTDPQGLLADLLERVVGMDVNPLAVIVAKATYVLAIADLLPRAREIVNIPVYLCNSLSAQRRQDTASLFGDEVALAVGGTEFAVPLDLIRHGADYDQAISTTVAVARSFAGTAQPPSAAAEGARARLNQLADSYVQGALILDSLSAMAVRLVELIRARSDTIYGFLLRNKYRSVLLYQHFDLIVGNPPWLTIADITAPRYHDLVLERAEETGIAPRTAGEQAHTEIATLFVAQAFRQFLAPRQDDGTLPRLAFVMPRSVFSATHHRNLRDGSYRVPFNVSELWDLSGVEPLFNVPSCVLIATSGIPTPTLPKSGRVYSGRLPARDPAPAVATGLLKRDDVRFVLVRLGRRTAWVREPGSKSPGSVSEAESRHRVPVSPYQRRFRQGAVLYPQTLLCVRPIGAQGRGLGDVAVETDATVRAAAKVLAEAELHGVVERSSLFSTAAAEHVLPYAVAPTVWTVVLPVLSDPGQPGFSAVSPDELRRGGRIGTADWFDEADALWRSVNRKPAPPLWERVNHLGHLSAQASRSRWLVLYTSAGSRPVAAVVDSMATEYPLVVRDQTYWASFYDVDEANYLVAMLNSDEAADGIRAFMTTGLFGPRHIHKRVLDLPIPLYNADDERHRALARLGAKLSTQAISASRHLEGVRNVRRQVRTKLDIADLALVEELTANLLTTGYDS